MKVTDFDWFIRVYQAYHDCCGPHANHGEYEVNMEFNLSTLTLMPVLEQPASSQFQTFFDLQ